MRTGRRNVWSFELKAEDLLEDQDMVRECRSDMAELEIDITVICSSKLRNWSNVTPKFLTFNDCVI